MHYFLFLLAGIVLAGEINRAGSIVRVDEPTAKNLLRRGKARPATEDELRAAGLLTEPAEDTDAAQPSEPAAPNPDTTPVAPAPIAPAESAAPKAGGKAKK